MTNRNRIEIISQILEAAKGEGRDGVRKTKIMYRTFMSHDHLKEYLAILTINGLLDYDLVGKTFKITEKGIRFLETYDQMGNLIKIHQ